MGFRSITRALPNKEQVINEAFARIAPVDVLSNRSLDNDLLSLALSDGTLHIYGQWVAIGETALLMTASATNYVELTPTDPYSLSSNTTAFTPGRVPLFQVTTDATTITAVLDRRQFLNLDQPGAQTTQKIAYAAAITPDAFDGRYVEVGELTGAITINAPTNPPASNGSDSGVGYELIFMFQQDVTGSRVITWNSVFKKAADGAGGASQVGSTRFVYDRGNWVQVGGALAWF